MMFATKEMAEEKFIQVQRVNLNMKTYLPNGQVYEAWRPYSKSRVYMNEDLWFATDCVGSLLQLENALVTKATAADVKDRRRRE